MRILILQVDDLAMISLLSFDKYIICEMHENINTMHENIQFKIMNEGK